MQQICIYSSILGAKVSTYNVTDQVSSIRANANDQLCHIRPRKPLIPFKLNQGREKEMSQRVFQHSVEKNTRHKLCNLQQTVWLSLQHLVKPLICMCFLWIFKFVQFCLVLGHRLWRDIKQFF